MHFSIEATFFLLSLFCFLFSIHLLRRGQMDPTILYLNEWEDPNSTCRQKILQTQKYLEVEAGNGNVTFTCEALIARGCEETHKRWAAWTFSSLLMISSPTHFITRYSDLADPESVYNRSLSCDLAWPQYSSISQEELSLPLAYVITVFSDPSNIELPLATAFRPHNSYCLHIDPKSDHVFR